MPRPMRAMVAFSMVALVAGTGGAQQRTLAETPPGERVQLVMRDSLRQDPIFSPRQWIVGQFVQATADSIWIQPFGAAPLGVAKSYIKTARVSRGMSRWRSALTTGFAWGFGFAAAVAVDQLDENQDHEGRNILVGAGVGAGAGMLLGVVRPFEHWRRVRP